MSHDFPPRCDSSVGGVTDEADEERGGGAQMDESQLRGKALGGSPPPRAPDEELGRGSISSPVSLMGGMRASSSSDRGTNSGWAMKLWMELRDSGLSSPAYRELRNAFTTLICNKDRRPTSERAGRHFYTKTKHWQQGLMGHVAVACVCVNLGRVMQKPQQQVEELNENMDGKLKISKLHQHKQVHDGGG